MDQGIQEETIRENADKEGVGSYDRCERRVYAKKGKGLPTVKGRKRGSKRIYSGTVKEGVHLAVKVTTNGASILYMKEGQKETDGAELQVFE